MPGIKDEILYALGTNLNILQAILLPHRVFEKGADKQTKKDLNRAQVVVNGMHFKPQQYAEIEDLVREEVRLRVLKPWNGAALLYNSVS